MLIKCSDLDFPQYYMGLATLPVLSVTDLSHTLYYTLISLYHRQRIVIASAASVTLLSSVPILGNANQNDVLMLELATCNMALRCLAHA